MNTVQKFEAKQLEKIQSEKQVPEFGPGDTVRVNVRVKEGTRERIQAYEGVCISRKGSGINENFTVRKISYGEGVERVFPLWSSRIDSVELVRRGSVRRAKLYYLRDRRGKSARIAERMSGHGIETEVNNTQELSKTAKIKAKKAEKEARRAEARKKADEIKAAKDAEKKAAQEAKAAEAAAAEAEAQAAENQAEDAPANETPAEE